MRSRAESDLFFFAQQVLGFTLLAEEPHRALCAFLSRPGRTGKKLILMPRGSLKTSLVTVAYSLWRLLRDSSERLLIDSDLRANAKHTAGLIRRHLESNPKVRQLWGDLRKETGWTEDFFTLRRLHDSKEPSVMTAGMDQVVVGLHFDRIIADDLVNNTNINTKEALDKAEEHVRLLLPLLEVPEINPSRELILVGTRWDDDDIYGRILRSSGLDEDEVRLRLDGGEAQIGEWDVFFRTAYWQDLPDGRGGVRRSYLQSEGTPLFPVFTEEFLAGQRSAAGMGSYLFASNYLNDPVPVADATFRREWFRYWTPPLPDSDELDVLMAVDPAISEHKHGDFSAIVVGAVTPAKDIYLLEAWKDRVNPHDLIEKIYQLYLEYRPRVVGLEQVAFQRALRYMLEDEAPKRGVWIPVVELRPDTSETKEMRIRSLQPLYQEGKIYHTKEMTALEMELVRFRFTKRGQKDDLADALAYLRAMTMPPAWSRGRSRPYVPECRTTGY